MRAIALNTSTYTDLRAQGTPFLPGMTVVAEGVNGTTIVAADDAAGTNAATIATLTTAAPRQTLVLSNSFVKSGTNAATLTNN